MTVPECSACGQAVDWLRSCYASKWRLFRGDPSIETNGTYYFSPDGTPFVSSFHRLGSNTWHDRTYVADVPLGEVLGAPKHWSEGALPARVPTNRFVGSAQCLQDGEPATGGIQSGDLIAGFNPLCFVPLPAVSRSWFDASDYQSDSIQLMGAQIISWSYDWDGPRIVAFLSEFLGPAWTVTFTPSTATLPSVTVAVSSTGTLVWIDGTSTFQQFALQAAYGLQPPQNITNFSTSLFWYDAASYVHSVIVNAGALPDQPISIVGHSYGGATALILAARYRSANPDRPIRYITYGAPHIGDGRLIQLIRSTDGISLVNTDDIVAAIPPNSPMVFTLVNQLLNNAFLNWLTWAAAPERTAQAPDGTLTPHDEYAFDWPTLLAFAIAVLSGSPFVAIRPHDINEYRRRILLRAPVAKWPLTPADYEEMEQPTYIITESKIWICSEIGEYIVMG